MRQVYSQLHLAPIFTQSMGGYNAAGDVESAPSAAKQIEVGRRRRLRYEIDSPTKMPIDSFVRCSGRGATYLCALLFVPVRPVPCDIFFRVRSGFKPHGTHGGEEREDGSR